MLEVWCTLFCVNLTHIHWSFVSGMEAMYVLVWLNMYASGLWNLDSG